MRKLCRGYILSDIFGDLEKMFLFARRYSASGQNLVNLRKETVLHSVYLIHS